MYVVPLIAILLIALAIFFSPALAGILFVVALIGLGVLKYFAGATEPEHAPPPAQAPPSPGSNPSDESDADEEETGPWGERSP